MTTVSFLSSSGTLEVGEVTKIDFLVVFRRWLTVRSLRLICGLFYAS
jgi:hypothetical protein